MFSLGENRPQCLSMGYILQKINVSTPIFNTPFGLALKIMVKPKKNTTINLGTESYLVNSIMAVYSTVDNDMSSASNLL